MAFNTSSNFKDINLHFYPYILDSYPIDYTSLGCIIKYLKLVKEHHASLESEKQKSESTQVLTPANDNSVWKFSLLIKKKMEKIILVLGVGERMNLR